jgi:hypothetical protein
MAKLGFSISHCRLTIIIIVSIIWYYMWLFVPIAATNCVQSCASSYLWKVALVGGVLTLLVFAYTILETKTRSFLYYGFFSVLFVLDLVVSYVAGAVPAVIAMAFTEVYNITISMVEFPFASGMILFLTIISALMSFNVGIAFPAKVQIAKGFKKQLKFAWVPVVRNFSIYVGITLRLKGVIDFFKLGGGNAELYSFTILMAANMLIPILHPVITRLSKRVITILGFIGLSIGLASVCDLEAFFGGTFPLIHPFVVFAFYSSACVCISSALGELAYKFVDLRSLREKRSISQFLVACLSISLLVVVTWFLSHAHITVGLG